MDMDIAATKAASIKLLNEFYNIDTVALPTQRPKSQWNPENKRGFFLGIIQNGEEPDLRRLHDLLASDQFSEQQNFSKITQMADPEHQPTFIDEMFARYIVPFHKDYSDSSTCHTPVSSKRSSRQNSVQDLDFVPEQREPTHADLKKSLEKRDVVCLFCWQTEILEGAHIIAKKKTFMEYDESSLLLRAGLTSKHTIQNGLLLCNHCHALFDRLRRYVDVADDKLVVKVVNYSVLKNDDKHNYWIDQVETIKEARIGKQKRFPEFSGRKTVESNGEMSLYFVHADPALLPNIQSLQFHKAACLIWRMAGGAESEEEHCPDDDGCHIPVDYRSKGIQKWVDSSATLVLPNIQ